MQETKFQKGFTLMELLVVISIIGLIASIIAASLHQAIAKARYAVIAEDMDSMLTAAGEYYQDQGVWAADDDPGSGPAFVPQYLGIWPTPPCKGWMFDWDNIPGQGIRVSLRDANYFYTGPSGYHPGNTVHIGYAVLYACVEGSDCSNRGSDTTGVDFKLNKINTITCNE